MYGFSSPFRPTSGAARRPRNPRFAPEFLERRLSPVALFGPPMTAEFATFDFSTTDPEPAPDPDGDGSPPIDFPHPEGGPMLPD